MRVRVRSCLGAGGYEGVPAMDPDQGGDVDVGQYNVHPSVLLLLGTLLLTAGATAMLCAAIMTDHWEHVTWDQTRIEHIAKTAPPNLTRFSNIGKVSKHSFGRSLVQVRLG